jgi:hypothetical protein
MVRPARAREQIFREFSGAENSDFDDCHCEINIAVQIRQYTFA